MNLEPSRADIQVPYVLLEFEYCTTILPFEIGLNADCREVAVGFIKIVATDALTGDVIEEYDFRREFPPNVKVLYGMSAPEDWGAWSAGKRTAILLNLPIIPAKINLQLDHWIVGTLATNTKMRVNGSEVADLLFVGGSVTAQINTSFKWGGSNPPKNVSLSVSDEIELSIIIPNLDRPELVFLAVDSILRSRTKYTYEIIVIENGSCAQSRRELELIELPVTTLYLEKPRSFGTANNIAVEHARGKYVLFLNNDAFVREGLLELLVEALGQEGTGAAGPTFLFLDDTLQELGGSINVDGFSLSPIANRSFNAVPDISSVDYISAACLVMRRENFLCLGGFDPIYDPAYCEDADLALRLLSSGKRTNLVKNALAWHIKNGTSSSPNIRGSIQGAIRRNAETFRSRWGHWLASRQTSDLPQTDLFVFDRLKRQLKGFPGQVVNCVSISEQITFHSGWHSMIATSVALSERCPTMVVVPSAPSLIELCSFARHLALDPDGLMSADGEALDEREIDVHVLSSRQFPCVAPAQGRVRVLHCPAPLPLNDEHIALYQRRVGGFLNFDAVVTDSEFSRQECLRILDQLNAPRVPICVIRPSGYGVLPLCKKDNLIVCFGPLRIGPGGGMHERVLGLFAPSARPVY